MVMEIQTTTYACSLCQRKYTRREDAEKCETLCGKLLKSPDISILGLNARTYNILKIAGIDTIDDVRETTDGFLLKLKGFGPACLEDLHYRLKLLKGQHANADPSSES
ncbi:DNA-directed RNA polymerase subunit alpha C-terminal domain-containing protein [Desulfosporosinus sp. PR]|uniref:DNA-directed RNA polymerase subunit alpha C-terminal domain-containing protein n=1 Tax=Candidatus Desulfosporosinus nitrosoreducens TaxID=3401928 RepID=UPI0027F1E98C|nr:DNA-directed RNA polymerase subunit alpha C-terminal domain-containing protein [Desulfosporosinus sp. PR]MDQ7097159.1 DNA-directed RNA polymerase subunit alpha C-terminal domain-containing protein [Desulfosporosinus sp. PR]